MQLYLCPDGVTVIGPFTAQELRKMLAQNEISTDTLASEGNDAEWRPLGECIIRRRALEKSEVARTFTKDIVLTTSFLVLVVSLLLGWFVASPFFWVSGVAAIIGMFAIDTSDIEEAKQKKEIQRLQRERDQQSQIFCPHCQTRGHVTTRQIKRKKGISGAKATAAILTGGLTILGTGLSRKEHTTEATCSNCGSTWHF